MLALLYTARKCERYQLHMCAISHSKHTKFILRVFWSIIRKLAPMKISCYTVTVIAWVSFSPEHKVTTEMTLYS